MKEQKTLVRANTLEEKVVRIQHRKHVLGVAVVIFIPYSVQRQGKRVITAIKKNHFERVCRQRFRSNTGHGESLNHLTASSPITRSESDSIMVSLQYKLYFLTFLIIKRYLLRKTRQKSHLSNKPTTTNLLLSKLTLTNLFLRTILQDQYKPCRFLSEIQHLKECQCDF